jgi:hypothetical protein
MMGRYSDLKGVLRNCRDETLTRLYSELGLYVSTNELSENALVYMLLAVAGLYRLDLDLGNRKRPPDDVLRVTFEMVGKEMDRRRG